MTIFLYKKYCGTTNLFDMYNGDTLTCVNNDPQGHIFTRRIVKMDQMQDFLHFLKQYLLCGKETLFPDIPDVLSGKSE